jgi:hypothetical protein
MVAITPMLIQSAAAAAQPKRVITEECTDDRFEGKCPGKSEDSSGRAGDERDEEVVCEARNEGQAKQCPPGSRVVIV